MSNKMKVSVYVPVYNGENTIESCINSLLSQTKNFDEIIIINDASTDSTLKKIEKFKEIKIINNQYNYGLSKSRNIAINECKYDLVANVDADIMLDKNWLSKTLEVLKSGEIVFCGGNTKEKYLDNIFNKWRNDYYNLSWGEVDIVNPPFIYGSNSIQHKSLWKEVDGYNENLKTAGDDVDYSYRVNKLKKYKTFYKSSAISYHLQNDNLNTLANRVWRYHIYGYKIRKVSFLRSLKLIIKQFNFFFKRSFNNIISLKFSYILINFYILGYFIFNEIKYFAKKDKNGF